MNDVLACMMMSFSSLVMSSKFDAKCNALLRRFLRIISDKASNNTVSYASILWISTHLSANTYFLCSVRHRKYDNETELSKDVWILKDSNKDYKVAWYIVA